MPDENKANVSQSVIDKLNAAGFDTSEGLSKYEDGYIVEYDIFIKEEDLSDLTQKKLSVSGTTVSNNPRANTKNIAKSGQPISHYQAGSTLTYNAGTNKREITIFMGTSFGIFMQNALDSAISRYNDLNLILHFSRASNSATASITISPVSGQSFLMQAGFPSGGNPYNQILINTDYYNSYTNRLDAISTIAHEIGHTIGFRHSDYMDRTFSCGGAASSESSATHIPYTPTGPAPNSWMLACSSNTDRKFTSQDSIALHVMYPLRKNIYVKPFYTLISDDSYAAGCCADYEDVTYQVEARFYQDPGYSIPYTISEYFLLNTNSHDAGTHLFVVPRGVTSVNLGILHYYKYYSYGALEWDNSTGFSGLLNYGGYRL